MICPNCKVKSTDKDYDNGTERISFWITNDGWWMCECFDCNCEWKQKGRDGKPIILVKGD